MSTICLKRYVCLSISLSSLWFDLICFFRSIFFAKMFAFLSSDRVFSVGQTISNIKPLHCYCFFYLWKLIEKNSTHVCTCVCVWANIRSNRTKQRKKNLFKTEVDNSLKLKIYANKSLQRSWKASSQVLWQLVLVITSSQVFFSMFESVKLLDSFVGFVSFLCKINIRCGLIRCQE